MRPLRLERIPVKIAKLDRTTTTWDADFREPVGAEKYLPEQTINVQVRFTRAGQMNILPTGQNPLWDGYLVLYPEEVKNIQIGDKITQITEIACEAYITEIRPIAYYGNKPTLYRAYFSERQKA